MIKIYLGIWY